MPFELDFHPVGQSSRSGDAITLRFGGLTSALDQRVVVIDGGFFEVGRSLVDHIRSVYGTNHVDLVVSTHPDGDHTAGLETVLREMQVDQLWMHQPWLHTYETHGLYRDRRVTPDSVRRKLQKALEEAQTLETLALERRIPITEPFTGTQEFGGVVFVLGPTRDYYQYLLPQFRSTPEAEALDAIARALTASLGSRQARLLKRLRESLWAETLDDGGQTSAENNTSVILSILVDGKRMILTADAGIPALSRAADLLEAANLDPLALRFMQVPHHGSKENVGPTVLDRLVGPIGARAEGSWRAYVCASPAGAPLHPAKKVTNAFRRRGAAVSVTESGIIYYFDGVPIRPGWGPVQVLPLFDEVEE